MSWKRDYEVRVCSKYRLTHKLGSGSFGVIYLAEDVTQNMQRVAVKMEELSTHHPQLINEARILKSFETKDRFPQFKWFGEEGDFNVLVMDLLGPSLEDLYIY